MSNTEADRLAEERLELMPRGVRDKLDRVGIKLHLKDWQALSMAERERLRDLPCDSSDDAAHYAAEVERLVLRVTGRPAERLRRALPKKSDPKQAPFDTAPGKMGPTQGER